MRNAASEGKWQGSQLIIICRKSKITNRIMRKKSSKESLDFVKLIDRLGVVFGQKAGLCKAATGSLNDFSCLARVHRY